MSPTHTNKLGVRYRYYVSHALLQKRRQEVGSIARVPAPEIEILVLEGVRGHLAAAAEAEPPSAIADRDLIERHVERIVVKPKEIEVQLLPHNDKGTPTDPDYHGREDADRVYPSSATMVAGW
jgi:site-specific DNA recombinase